MLNVTIVHNPNKLVTTYRFDRDTHVMHTLRLNLTDGELVDASIVSQTGYFIDEIRDFALQVFAIPGVTNERTLGGLTISNREVAVVREESSDEGLVEDGVIDALGSLFGIPCHGVAVTVDDYRRSEAYQQKVEASREQYRELGLDDDMDGWDYEDFEDVYPYFNQ